MTKPTVAIVGGGPSAAFALMACTDLGIEPSIYSRGISIQPGAFWFHKLPETFSRDFKKETILVELVGRRQDYIDKQWKNYQLPEDYASSFPLISHHVLGYSPAAVLTDLYLRRKQFKFHELTGNLDDDGLKFLSTLHDFVFHSFPTQTAQIENQDIIVNLPIIIEAEPNNSLMVVYNGLKDTTMVRISHLWGYKFTELPPVKKVEGGPIQASDALLSFIKDLVPTDRLVDFFQLRDQIIPIGRLARFDRKALSHDAYDLVRGTIENY